MSLTMLVVLALGGTASGLLGYLTGLASLVSYPILLASGLTPVLANTSNTVAVVTQGIGASWSALPTLRSMGPRVLWRTLVSAMVGGLIGSGLLLVGGNGTFKALAPWLIASACLVLLFSARLRTLHGDHDSPLGAAVAIVVLCIYGGYFGAGAGVMYIAVMSVLSGHDLGRHLLVKSAVFGLANLSATVIFILTGNVDWPAAIALGLGSLLGGWLGPKVQPHIPSDRLKIAVALGGFVLSGWLLMS